MKERKRKLRKQIAVEKTKYSASTLTALSVDILLQLEAHPLFRDAHSVLMYYSMNDEVQTHEFVHRWSSEKNILLPAVVGDELELRRFTGTDDLAVGSYGIAEPTDELVTNYDCIDLVVVPGLAFDRLGQRLGRGKGYYDRLLPQIKAPKLGICFPFQLVDEVPSEPFDVRMDGVITLSEK